MSAHSYEVFNKAQLPQRYPNVTSLCFATLFRLTPPDLTYGFRWDYLRKSLHGGQMIWLRYKMGKKYCRKLQPLEYGARTLQTTDTDGFATGKTRT